MRRSFIDFYQWFEFDYSMGEAIASRHLLNEVLNYQLLEFMQSPTTRSQFEFYKTLLERFTTA